MRRAGWAVLLSLAAVQTARADDCDLVTNAMIRQMHVAHRMDLAVTQGGQLFFGSIFIKVDGKVYTKITGFISSVNWDVKPWNGDEEEAGYRQQIAKNKETCRLDGSDTLGGETADVVIVDVEDGKGSKTETRWWIGHASGLPLKNEGPLANGEVSTMNWNYADVAAPDTTFHLR